MRIALYHINYTCFGVDTTPLSYTMSSLEKYFSEDIIYPVNTIDTLIDTNPDIVCFYLKDTFLFNKFLEISSDLKNKLNIEMILFGEHITVLPKTLPKHIDVGIVGEYEETIYDIVSIFKKNKFSNKNEFSKIKGLVFFDKNQKLILTEKRNHIKNIDNLQFTRKNFYGMPDFWIPTITTGRGNNFKNIFTPSSNIPIRLHSYEWLMGNCVDIITYFPKIDFVEILDYLLLYDRERFIKFAEIVKETNLSKYFRFVINSFPSQLNNEILYILKEKLNILKLNISLFSISEKIQNDVKEYQFSKEDLLKLLDKCKELNLETNLKFGLGSSIETQEEIAKHYWFIENNIVNNYDDIINISHKLYLPLFGTESLLRLNKKLSIEKIKDFSLLDPNNINKKSITLNDNLNIEELIYIKDYLYNKYEKKDLEKNETTKFNRKTIYNLNENINSEETKEELKRMYPNNYESIINEIEKSKNNYIRYGTFYKEDKNNFIYKDFSLYKELKYMLEDKEFNFNKIEDYFDKINKLYKSDEIEDFLYSKNITTIVLADILEIINKYSNYINNILQISDNTYNILDLLDKDKFIFDYINNDLFNTQKPQLSLSKKFDCIISVFTLNTSINTMRTIKYLYNILNKDGFLIINILNSNSIINIKNIIFNKKNSYLFRNKIVNYLNKNTLNELLVNNRFDILEIKDIKIPINNSYSSIDVFTISILNKIFNIDNDYSNFVSTIIARKL